MPLKNNLWNLGVFYVIDNSLYTQWLWVTGWFGKCPFFLLSHCIPDSKVHGANMGPHVGPMNLAIWDVTRLCVMKAGIGTCVYDKLRLLRLHINHFGNWKMCVLRITQHELTGFPCLDAGTDKLYIDNKYPDFLTIFLDIRKCWMNVPLPPIIFFRSAHANQKVDIGSLFRKKTRTSSQVFTSTRARIVHDDVTYWVNTLVVRSKFYFHLHKCSCF